MTRMNNNPNMRSPKWLRVLVLQLASCAPRASAFTPSPNSISHSQWVSTNSPNVDKSHSPSHTGCHFVVCMPVAPCQGGMVRGGGLPSAGLGTPDLSCLDCSRDKWNQNDKVISCFSSPPKSLVLCQLNLKVSPVAGGHHAGQSRTSQRRRGLSSGNCHSAEMTSSQRTARLSTWSPALSIFLVLSPTSSLVLGIEPRASHGLCQHPCCLSALLCCFLLFGNKVSVCCPGCPRTHSVTQAEPPVPVALPPPPKAYCPYMVFSAAPLEPERPLWRLANQ